MHRVGRAVVLNLGGPHGRFEVGFRWVFQTANFSTNSSSNVMMDYLMTSLGFSEKEATVTSSKVRTYKSPTKPAFVVHFLEQSGLDLPHIKKIIYQCPKIFTCDVDKVIKPRMKVLQNLGLSGSDLAMVICANHQIWWRSLNFQLMPVFQCFKSICSDETVSKALMQFAFLAHPSALGNLPDIVALLQDYGFSRGDFEKLVLEKPKVFIMNPKRVHDILVKVENKMQIPRDSLRFFTGFQTLVSMSEKTIDSKIETYKSFGFTEEQVWALAGKMPANLRLSETKIRDGLNFYVKVVGVDSSYLVAWPILPTFSLKNRVIPRWTLFKGLKEKGLIRTDYPLARFLALSEQKFAKFVLRFRDEASDIVEDYFRRTDSLG